MRKIINVILLSMTVLGASIGLSEPMVASDAEGNRVCSSSGTYQNSYGETHSYYFDKFTQYIKLEHSGEGKNPHLVVTSQSRPTGHRCVCKIYIKGGFNAALRSLVILKDQIGRFSSVRCAGRASSDNSNTVIVNLGRNPDHSLEISGL